MGREINPFGLRMPEDLKRQLIDSARLNGRSLNAELVLRLQQSIEQDPHRVPGVREPVKGYKLTRDKALLLERYDGLSRRRQKALVDLLSDLPPDE